MNLRTGFLLVSTLFASFGCDEAEVIPDAGGPVTGEASLSFTVTFGEAAAQFSASDWQPALTDALLTPTAPHFSDTRIVVLVCEGTDSSCSTPRITHEVTADEMTADPILPASGPRVTLEGLPPGRFRIMVIADSGLSRANGLGWQDDFETTESAWGGIASELDMMLGDAEGEAATVAATLTDGESTDLGVLALDHVHERDLSPPAPTETGTLVVAVDEGLRLIDTQTLRPRRREPFVLENAAGTPFPSTPCGLIPGPETTVFVMFEDTSVGAGFAVQFNVMTQSQLHAGNRVIFPGFGAPCRGQYHEGRLYVTNAKTTNGSAEGIAGENFWVVDPGGLASADAIATVLNRANHPALVHGIDDFVFDGDTLYATISGNPGAVDIPPECRTSYCVYSATLGATGIPTFDGTHWVGPQIDGSYRSDLGLVTCVAESSPWTSLHVASFHDGRTLLFLGGCLEIAVFDVSDGSPLDFSPLPGTQGIDGTAFGYAFTSFARSPDGNTLWALPQRPSAIPLVFPEGADGATRGSYSRYMAMAIDLTQGAEPGLAAAFNAVDLDDHEGAFEGSTLGYETPAIDPGLDLNLASYAAYAAQLVPAVTSLQTPALPTGANMIVRPGALWLRGSASPRAGASGLGKAADLVLLDLASGSMVLFPNDDSMFYAFWHGGGDLPGRLGFDIDDASPDAVTTHAFAFVPTN